jgi:glycosyltransferase involved in cell wall biosynthesis
VKIAVMIAAHNAAPYIADTLGSLLRQRDAAQLDIIVVDDGSTDGTSQIALAIGAPEVRLARQENMGVTRTRNTLLSMLAPDTDFVTVLDADDLSPAGRFVRDLVQFTADDALDLVFGSSLLFRTTGPDPLEPDFSAPTVRVRGIQMGAGLYRYGLIQRTGRYDESFQQAEDLDFMLRMLDQSPKFLITQDIGYYYRRHQQNMTHDNSTLTREVARALLLAARRKKRGNLPDYPPGFFDYEGYAGNIGW